MNALFICSRNRLRSPTAAEVCSSWPGVETDSAGLASDADVVLSSDHVEWADIILVMEKAHLARLKRDFGSHLRHKRVVCLDIPDEFTFMQPELIALVEARAGRFLKERRRP